MEELGPLACLTSNNSSSSNNSNNKAWVVDYSLNNLLVAYFLVRNIFLKYLPFYPIACIGTGLGLGNTTVNGTTIKFEVYYCENDLCLSDTTQAPAGTDTVVRNGTNHNTATKLQCISAMKQYENYCMEVSTCPYIHF